MYKTARVSDRYVLCPRPGRPLCNGDRYTKIGKCPVASDHGGSVNVVSNKPLLVVGNSLFPGFILSITGR